MLSGCGRKCPLAFLTTAMARNNKRKMTNSPIPAYILMCGLCVLTSSIAYTAEDFSNSAKLKSAIVNENINEIANETTDEAIDEVTNEETPSAELLEFLAAFADTDDEVFELILFHGKEDAIAPEANVKADQLPVASDED